MVCPSPLQQQQQKQHFQQLPNEKYNTASNNNHNNNNNSRALGFMKSRFYSASSETVNNNNNNNNTCNNINYLVSPPPHYPSQLKRFSPFFTQAVVQQPVATHKSLENLGGHDQQGPGTPSNNFLGATNSSQFSHQKRRRPLYSHNNPYSTSSKDDQGFNGVQVSRGCVYLRPEQNIPDVFSTAFKPINESSLCKADDDDDNDSDHANEDLSSAEKTGSGEQTISRDDIVVTMRSVNV